MGTEPVSAGPFQPAPALAPLAPAARSGYDEMVRILCQRRHRRTVLVVVWVHRGEGAGARLERSVRVVVDHLGRLGVSTERLADDRLGLALRRLGWESEGAP